MPGLVANRSFGTPTLQPPILGRWPVGGARPPKLGVARPPLCVRPPLLGKCVHTCVGPSVRRPARPSLRMSRILPTQASTTESSLVLFSLASCSLVSSSGGSGVRPAPKNQTSPRRWWWGSWLSQSPSARGCGAGARRRRRTLPGGVAAADAGPPPRGGDIVGGGRPLRPGGGGCIVGVGRRRGGRTYVHVSSRRREMDHPVRDLRSHQRGGSFGGNHCPGDPAKPWNCHCPSGVGLVS